MKTLRIAISASFLMFLCSGMSFASAQQVKGTNDVTPVATGTSGPAPVPICSPDEGWCDTLPPKRAVDNSGPAPVPICSPDEGWCDTLPPKRSVDNSGPAPVPICSPDEGWCDTLPPKAHVNGSTK
jgi:hypothetical protein